MPKTRLTLGVKQNFQQALTRLKNIADVNNDIRERINTQFNETLNSPNLQTAEGLQKTYGALTSLYDLMPADGKAKAFCEQALLAFTKVAHLSVTDQIEQTNVRLDSMREHFELPKLLRKQQWAIREQSKQRLQNQAGLLDSLLEEMRYAQSLRQSADDLGQKIEANENLPAKLMATQDLLSKYLDESQRVDQAESHSLGLESKPGEFQVTITQTKDGVTFSSKSVKQAISAALHHCQTQGLPPELTLKTNASHAKEAMIMMLREGAVATKLEFHLTKEENQLLARHQHDKHPMSYLLVLHRAMYRRFMDLMLIEKSCLDASRQNPMGLSKDALAFQHLYAKSTEFSYYDKLIALKLKYFSADGIESLANELAENAQRKAQDLDNLPPEASQEDQENLRRSVQHAKTLYQQFYNSLKQHNRALYKDLKGLLDEHQKEMKPSLELAANRQGWLSDQESEELIELEETKPEKGPGH